MPNVRGHQQARSHSRRVPRRHTYQPIFASTPNVAAVRCVKLSARGGSSEVDLTVVERCEEGGMHVAGVEGRVGVR